MMLYGGQDGAVHQGCLPGAAAMGLLSHTFIQLLCSSFFLSPPPPQSFHLHSVEQQNVSDSTERKLCFPFHHRSH